jgi:glycosyltransferase involved in cell wall biosynthesis
MPELTASAQLNGPEIFPEGSVPQPAVSLPVSVIIPVKNEAKNLRACLESLRGAGEVYVVDSQSTDATVEIAREFGAKVVQFHYSGGWPKKRQWALDTLNFSYDWILLVDADESVTPELWREIQRAIRDSGTDGFYVALDLFFLGRRLRHSGATFHKLALFRRGKGRFECRTREQDSSMCDMEVHEHVIVDGPTRRLKSRIAHRNVESIARYIQKHNEYSNWEARVWGKPGTQETLRPRLFGSQAERRRWVRSKFFSLPGSPVFFFFYKYALRLGFLDGVPGLIYCGFQAVQFFHIKVKLYEARVAAGNFSDSQPQLKSIEVSHVRH